MNDPKYTLTDRGSIQKDRAARDSGIELLKVLAIFLVVLSHVVQTLSIDNSRVAYQDYIIDLSRTTTDLQQLIATMLRYSGELGNTLFFICSAWFLLDSKQTNKRKLLQLLADIWVISVAILAGVLFQRGGQIDGKTIIKQLFPTTFSNNWYMTCYLVFSLIFPFLNLVLSKIDQRTLLRLCIVLLTLYVGFNYFAGELFFSSNLILWVTIYFTIAYMKRYLLRSANSLRFNLLLLLMGIGGNCAIVMITNCLGLKFSFFADKLLRWNVNCSPFILLAAIALFNISRMIHFQNAFINHISKLSYLIYIIHENMLLRQYYRPVLWGYVHKAFGYEYLLLWILVLSVFIFIFGLCGAFIYEQTLQRVIARISNSVFNRAAQMWDQLEKKLLGLQ